MVNVLDTFVNLLFSLWRNLMWIRKVVRRIKTFFQLIFDLYRIKPFRTNLAVHIFVKCRTVNCTYIRKIIYEKIVRNFCLDSSKINRRLFITLTPALDQQRTRSSPGKWRRIVAQQSPGVQGSPGPVPGWQNRGSQKLVFSSWLSGVNWIHWEGCSFVSTA